MFDQIKNALVPKKEYHCLPAVFQKGTEPNKEMTKYAGGAMLAAMALYGVAGIFGFLCDLDTKYNSYKQATED